MENKVLIDLLTSFYDSEKNIFLVIVLIGISSVIIGIAFYFFSANYKVFGIALLVLGMLETGIFTYQKLVQKEKIEQKISILKTDTSSFLQTEKVNLAKMTQVYFWIKLFYGCLIICCIVAISFSNKPLINSVLMALILHLALAITIDNFAEQYTLTYKAKIEELE